ncbi:MAG: hypothetical protein U9Q82_15625 [Chloroflexota bacterium]|nr:hypothetical protein [Chloroflexota bacterium]
MIETTKKPLHFIPDPNAGYTVARRADGGMQLTFEGMNEHTLAHWREFSAEHLLGSDRLTRNLYDLRQVDHISEEAIQIAVELNTDPSTRNIRLAVVVADDEVRQSVQKVAALTPGGGARMSIFTDLDEAETWLNRPIESMV